MIVSTNDFEKKLMDVLIQRREIKNISYKTLAMRTGISPNALCNYFRGVNKPSMERMAKLMLALNVGIKVYSTDDKEELMATGTNKRLSRLFNEIIKTTTEDQERYHNNNLTLHQWASLGNEEFMEMMQAINETAPATATEEKRDMYGGKEKIRGEAIQAISILIRFVHYLDGKAILR